MTQLEYIYTTLLKNGKITEKEIRDTGAKTINGTLQNVKRKYGINIVTEHSFATDGKFKTEYFLDL